tara:strand:+ start:1413 stop:1544 length:132 start_codon:yes stop_codon:yes gene_type:complete
MMDDGEKLKKNYRQAVSFVCVFQSYLLNSRLKKYINLKMKMKK